MARSSRRLAFVPIILLASAAAIVANCGGSVDPPKAVSAQGWSPDEQTRWYSATQGSRLLPFAWFKVLEQADSPALFRDDANLTRFRLIPGAAANGLPIGFALDDSDDSDLAVTRLDWRSGQSRKEPWVGLNCSACHTGQLEFQGRPLRIDGGPSLFDYQSFVEELDRALVATRTDPEKWTRFRDKLLGTGADAAADKKLKDALDRLIEWEKQVDRLNETPLRYGYGRVDAFGHIFNKVALFSGASAPTPNPADAPVSYPFLWDIYRHDKLQWNGIASNARVPMGAGGYLDYGALGRNAGEVIGVFGDMVVRPGADLGGYTSSLQADNLIRLEIQLSTLRKPAWPAALFGALDDTEIKRQSLAAGAQVFEAHCVSCHRPQPGTAPYRVTMMPLQPSNPNATDPWMACNAITYRSATGNLQGTRKGYLTGDERFGADAQLADMLETVVKGALIGKKGQILVQTGRVFLGVPGAPRVVIEEAPDIRARILDACFASGSPFMAYKARPLDGIWATAPYLHNGSVPTLRDLLLPPARRPAQFRVGTREYDPVLVGYRTGEDAPGNGFTFDTALPGNSNMGHDYGASQMSEAERQNLLDYLKTL